MANKTLECVECGASFEFTDDHRARLDKLVALGKIEKWTEPKRCKPCRDARKRTSGGSGDGGEGHDHQGGGQREFHETKCYECGQKARVPFKPRGDRPVYCSDCFSKRK